ncbi:MAG: caspase, EACC1-associated type [Pseudonocardiaceae bacterium]
MGRRLALLIATYEYHDAGLRRLTAPAHDAESLAAVLEDKDIGRFEVTKLINAPHHRVGEAIGEFYRDRRRDDLTLLYFSGHGVKDNDGRLYLAMANTRRDSLLFTALSAEQIDQAMSDCPSHRQVLILDCCYSGAFPAGRLAKADTDVHALERFQGRGRTVLTASDATQYSFEGNQLHGEATQSVFTRYLVAGLHDGSADLDSDGDITLDELYSYVYDRVVAELPQQRPKKQDNVEGRTTIARNINWTLPAYLRNAISSPLATDRLGALDGLNHHYRTGNDVVRACVRDEIQRLTDDDSRMVSTAAVERLQSISLQPPKQVPDVSKPETEKAPSPPAPQAGPSGPIAGSVVAPDPATPTAQPQAIALQPPRRRLGRPLADFDAQVLSFLIDIMLPGIAFFTIWAAIANITAENDETGVTAILVPIVFAFAVWNSGYQQGRTGQSIGRRVTKTKLVQIETGEPIGYGMALLRLSCLTVTLGTGYLWSLWDMSGQTIADKIVNAVVVNIDDVTA